VGELKDATEAEPEEERAEDREQCRPELVRPALDEHAAERHGCRKREVEVTHEIIRECGGVRLEILLHHEDRGENRNQGVEREEC
jgi:hypothetical protein